MFDPIMDEFMPRPPGKEDWAYRDLPQIRSDFFAQLLDLVGEDNIFWITRAKYRHDDGVFERGQIFVSPAGIERIRAHNASKRGPGSPSAASAGKDTRDDPLNPIPKGET